MKYILMLLFLVGCECDCVQVPPVEPPVVEEPVVECGEFGKVRLSWDVPTKREDGTELLEDEIEGYDIEYRLVDDTEWKSELDDGSPLELELPWGNYAFRAATIGVDGLKSKWSDEIYVNLECED